jgi:hypothetical protein
MQVQSIHCGLLQGVVVVAEYGHSSRFDIEMGAFPRNIRGRHEQDVRYTYQEQVRIESSAQ